MKSRKQVAIDSALMLAVIAVASIGPFAFSAYTQKVLIMIYFAIAMASSYNLIGGFAGYPSFGHVVFVGMGAYTSGILVNNYQMPFPVTILVAGAVGGLFALFLGIPLLRLRGHYFAIATLGVQMAVSEAVSFFPWAGGGMGWTLPFYFSDLVYYYLFLLMAALVVVVTWLIRRSRLGLGLLAIATNETRAASLGIPVVRYRIVAYVLSGIFPAVLGSIYGSYLTYIDTSSVFAPAISINMIMYALLGGIGTIAGPVVGAVVLETINDILWSMFPGIQLIFYGLVVMLIVLFLPEGLVGFVRERIPRWWEGLAEKRRLRVATVPAAGGNPNQHGG